MDQTRKFEEIEDDASSTRQVEFYNETSNSLEFLNNYTEIYCGSTETVKKSPKYNKDQRLIEKSKIS